MTHLPPTGRHVLLTGAAGFIGSHTAQALLRRGDRVTGLDALDFGYDPRLKRQNAQALSVWPGFSLIVDDIRNADALAARMVADPPDVVVHMAARAGVRASLEDPGSYVDINVAGTVSVLQAMRAAGVDRLVFASSSSVYGVRPGGAFTEDQASAEPASPYAATKRAAELMCGTYHHLYGIQSTCLRFFTVYGPRQRPEMAIHAFAARILAGQPLTLFGDGSSERDYTYIDDIVAGVVAAIDRPLGHAVINLGRGQPVTLSELVAHLESALDRPAIIQRLGDQPGDVPRTLADIRRARDLLDYAPSTDIQAGLARFSAWLRDRS